MATPPTPRNQQISNDQETNEKTASSSPDESNLGIRRVFPDIMLIIRISFAVGSLAILFYGLTAASISEYFSIVITSLLLGWAMFAVGAFLGFLFGIPYSSGKRSLPADETQTPGTNGSDVENQPVPSLAYTPNTNLEQISDWLTKILVGVGLTQLTKIPGALQNIGSTLAPALGGTASSGLFAIAEIIYFGVCGFLGGFLWTRVKLPELYVLSDLEQKLASEVKKAEKKGEIKGKREAELNVLESTQEPLEISVSEAVSVTDQAAVPQKKYILWVDDQPENNSREIDILKTRLNVEVETAVSTDDAMKLIDQDQNKYALIISDMSRPEGWKAGFDLLEKVHAKNSKLPFVIYAATTTPEKSAEAKMHGAIRPNGPYELYTEVAKFINETTQENS